MCTTSSKLAKQTASSPQNPNLNNAQAVPGSNNGTGGGIIDISDHHKLVDILDGMTMLAASPDAEVAGAWTAADSGALMS